MFFFVRTKTRFFYIVIERRNDDVVARAAMAEDFADDAYKVTINYKLIELEYLFSFFFIATTRLNKWNFWWIVYVQNLVCWTIIILFSSKNDKKKQKTYEKNLFPKQYDQIACKFKARDSAIKLIWTGGGDNNLLFYVYKYLHIFTKYYTYRNWN